MSTWISDPVRVRTCASLVAVAVVLAACSSSRLGTMSARSRNAPTTISVAGKNVVIQGPPGFCVDNKLSQTASDTAFVLLGSCDVVSPSPRAPRPAVKALLTASVSANSARISRIANSGPDLDRFFRSENGRTALSRSSDPGTVFVLDTFQKDDMFFLRASDTSRGIVPGASQDYWRAYFDLQGQIASVSVIGFRSDPLPPEKSLATLREFARLIRIRNGESATPVTPVIPLAPAVPAPVPVAVAQTETIPPPVPKPRVVKHRSALGLFWSIGLLRKLLK